MKKIFKCDCNTHLVEISYESVTEWAHVKTKKKHKDNIPEFAIAIYDIYNPDTGRKYRKPKLTADVVFMACKQDSKNMDFIMKFLEDVTMQYLIRRK